jgi:hypothetical protein
MNRSVSSAVCGAWITQTVNAAKLAQQLPGSVHFN